MKKKVLCLFSLLCILLVFCTLVSPKAEEEMLTLVDARHGEGRGKGNLVIGNIAITWPHSDDVLFSITEGTGWEGGLRVSEIPSTYFVRYQRHVELGAGTNYWYIYSASREPVPGDAVGVVETHRGEDLYFLWDSGSIGSLDALPNSMEVVRRTDTTALIRCWGATVPFFEHNMLYSLGRASDSSLHVYSLRDFASFTEALPWITGLGAVLLCCLILWAASWLLSGNQRQIRICAGANTLLIATAMAILPLLLGKFDLPASMMPPDTILDISHYAQIFRRVLTGAEQLGEASIGMLFSQTVRSCAAVLTGCLAATALIVGFELILCRHAARRTSHS